MTTETGATQTATAEDYGEMYDAMYNAFRARKEKNADSDVIDDIESDMDIIYDVAQKEVEKINKHDEPLMQHYNRILSLLNFITYASDDLDDTEIWGNDGIIPSVIEDIKCFDSDASNLERNTLRFTHDAKEIVFETDLGWYLTD